MLPILAALSIAAAQQFYHEALRPQFHFTSKQNWLNDPNGLVFYKGAYHLFFQHNPSGINWGNMTWGHAVSPDLLHWSQLPDAIPPDALGTIFSGSAIVDWHNTTGFQQGNEKPIVCIYACAGDTSPESKGKPFTQCLSFSTDGGKTFTKFAGNPVLGEVAKSNRDPKVVWFEPKKEWVMALFLEGNDYALFTSPDLKHWEQVQRFTFPNAGECPDFFEMPVEGEQARKWVFVSAGGAYLVGDFDGKRFSPEQAPVKMDLGPNYYAVQTYSDIPPKDGRRIQIAWMNGGSYPGMPFNQQMSFPCRLTLHKTPEGLRIFRNPVAEISRLHGVETGIKNRKIASGSNAIQGLEGDLWHVKILVSPRTASSIDLGFRGATISYDVASQTLAFGQSKVSWPLKNGKLDLEALIDRTSVELFGNGGALSFTACYLPKPEDQNLALTVKGGEAMLDSAKIYRLQSVWP